MDRSKLIILAGPNGAGKSTFAENADLSFITELGITSFDYDLEFKKLYESFLSIMNPQIENNIAYRTKEIFEEQAKNALETHSHFSFQTNYDKVYTDTWRERFSKEGFNTELYFLYVDSTEKCIQRVAKRVQEGGHNVPEDEIIKRYKNGLQNFDNTFHKYDKVVFIDTSLDSNTLLLEICNSKISYIHENLIDVLFSQQLIQTIDWLHSALDNE